VNGHRQLHTPPDLHSPKAPRILPLHGVTLRSRRAPLYGWWTRLGTGPPRGAAVAVEAWHRLARRLVGDDARPRWVPAEFPSSFRRRAYVPGTGIRVPWRGSRSSRHGQELKRDRMGTDLEPRSLRIEPNGDRVGTRTLHDRADNRRRTGDPPLGSERAPMATATSPPAAGWELKRRSAARPAPRSVTRAGRAIRTAPNSGTSRRGALGANGRPEERSDGETGPRTPATTAESAREL
jgi:hypothetical protein